MSSLVALIAASVPLRKASPYLHFGRCPWHDDKTASLAVYSRPTRRAKPFYRCFGCGATGDDFAWIMQTQNVTFAEAKRILGHGPAKPDPKILAARRAEEQRATMLRRYRDRNPDCTLPDWAINV